MLQRLDMHVQIYHGDWEYPFEGEQVAVSLILERPVTFAQWEGAHMAEHFDQVWRQLGHEVYHQLRVAEYTKQAREP